MMAWITDPGIWLSLLTLTVLEIVLGIDNLIFLSILAGRLPVKKQANARRLGLVLALALRILLLLSTVWVMGLTQPLFAIAGHGFSWRDLILVGGGGFLLYKATQEIHANIEGEAPESHEDSGQKSRIIVTVVQ
ncbi:MAG: TerC family protein, partial [Acidobacteriota bacterium]